MAKVEANLNSIYNDRRQSRPLSTATAPFRLPPTNQGLSFEGNREWRSIVASITTLFQKRSSSYISFDQVLEKVRLILNSETGNLLYDYYQDHLLKKGMIILREEVKDLTGDELLKKLVILWNQFFVDILPALQILFHPIQTRHLSIRQVALVSFRDILLLKTKIEETILLEIATITPSIQQMLLVLLSVHDKSPPNEEYIRLEKMAAKVVKPYMPVSYRSNNLDTVTPDNPYLRRIRDSILEDKDIVMKVPIVLRSESASFSNSRDTSNDFRASLVSGGITFDARPHSFAGDLPLRRKHRVTVL
ncbi:Proline-rich protein 5-like [Trichoplax sp. H2]|nr:Proline-rich protein 5-like [Trichoplax sp. H2]|eukprot:RDD45850.1 Proline-rich protein 5-like [Trichoplax sp. H2]